MCGRFAAYNKKSIDELLDELGLEISKSQFSPRYNVAPAAAISAVIQQQAPAIASMTWGLQAEWMKTSGMQPMINARAETIHEKASFKNLIQRTRCVIPVNGFYEWKRLGQKIRKPASEKQQQNKGKRSFYFHAGAFPSLALAAIYQQDAAGKLQACIITTSANKLMAPVHDRMPVVLSPQSMRDWLLSEDQAQIDSLMQPCPDDWLRCIEVSSYVNNSRNEGARCIAPLRTI
jgi:putative SOS response-associated peptidase YedK